MMRLSFAVLLLSAAYADETWIEEKHQFHLGETLSEVLYERLGSFSDARLYGASGLVKLNQKKNPHVSNWKKITPGTSINLIYPSVPKPVHTPVTISPEIPVPSPPPVQKTELVPPTENVPSAHYYGVLSVNGSRIREIRGGVTSETDKRFSIPKMSVGVHTKTWDYRMSLEHYNAIATEKHPLGGSIEGLICVLGCDKNEWMLSAIGRVERSVAGSLDTSLGSSTARYFVVNHTYTLVGLGVVHGGFGFGVSRVITGSSQGNGLASVESLGGMHYGLKYKRDGIFTDTFLEFYADQLFLTGIHSFLVNQLRAGAGVGMYF